MARLEKPPEKFDVMSMELMLAVRLAQRRERELIAAAIKLAPDLKDDIEDLARQPFSVEHIMNMAQLFVGPKPTDMRTLAQGLVNRLRQAAREEEQ